MSETNQNLLHFTHFANMSKWSANAFVFDGTKVTYPLVKLSKVLTRMKEPVVIQDEIIYKRVTVRLYGQGVFQRDQVIGQDIGTKRQFVAHAGQLIISRIDARNGAFGIVSEELEGAIVTNDFWLFDVHDALPQYLMLVMSSELFQKYWQTQSSGTTNRQRVGEDDFLQSKIALPLPETQKEIVNNYFNAISKAKQILDTADNIEKGIISKWDSFLGLEDRQEDTNRLFMTMKFSQLFDWLSISSPLSVYRSAKYPTVLLSSLCKVNSGGTPSRANPSYFTGNIPWVKTGEVLDDYISDTEEKITEEALNSSSARIYPSGSIIIAMYGQTRGQTAKLLIDATTNQACAILHEIKTDIVSADYLWLYMQAQYNRIRKLAVGSAQPNLNAQMIKDYPVVLPPIRSTNGWLSQESIVAEIFSDKTRIKALRGEAESLRQRAKQEFEEAVFGGV